MSSEITVRLRHVNYRMCLFFGCGKALSPFESTGLSTGCVYTCCGTKQSHTIQVSSDHRRTATTDAIIIGYTAGGANQAN